MVVKKKKKKKKKSSNINNRRRVYSISEEGGHNCLVALSIEKKKY
jgi:hypothetical protein